MGEIKQTTCKLCGEPVEYDEDKPTALLNPARDKVKHPKALHFCSGKPKVVAGPPSLTNSFKVNPEDFLKAHVVMVDVHEQMPDAAGRKTIWKFKIVAGDRNGVCLQSQAEQGDFIEAYWLPWKTQRATSMDLGQDAKFFFTSEMTNCRFTVLDANKKAPKVAHVAGDLSGPTPRDKAEVAEGLPAKKDEPRARRLSVSDSRERAAPFGSPKGTPKIPKQHDYTGQLGEESKRSSAFVFGVRGDDGDWKFFAQIAKGTLAEGFFSNKLTEDLQILNYVQI